MNDGTKHMHDSVIEKASLAKTASRKLARARTEEKNAALQSMAQSLQKYTSTILKANEQDIEDSKRAGQGEGRIDRLYLNETRIREMAQGLLQVAALPDPIGESLEVIERENGLRIEKVRVPLGVLAIIYESRPNVTVDAAGLAFKSGNAVVLRGGKEALQTNLALVQVLRTGLQDVGFDPDCIQFIDQIDRATVDTLIRARGLVDLAIPRGGAGLIQRVVENATVPVIETGVGNCHVYVDESADLEKAMAIVINAKTQRPTVCNAMETLLVHKAIAKQWLQPLAEQLWTRGVEIRGCEETIQILQLAYKGEWTRTGRELLARAEPSDWEMEFLDCILAIRIVRDVEEAMEHIRMFGTLHSEAIVTEDLDTAAQFLQQVDAAAVYHNASTRFTDGFEFGFGAEIGISTQKLHARGPMGVKELTSYKYIVRGNGQIRNG